jgi:PKD repeat protein
MAAIQQFLVVELGGKTALQQMLAQQTETAFLKANFSAEPLEGGAPLAVQFTDHSEGDPVTWEWDFEDDGIIDDTVPYPLHIFTTPGNYTVVLTVKNASAEHKERKEGYIQVNTTGNLSQETLSPQMTGVENGETMGTSDSAGIALDSREQNFEAPPLTDTGTSSRGTDPLVLGASGLLGVFGAGGLWLGLRIRPLNRTYTGFGLTFLAIAAILIVGSTAGFPGSGANVDEQPNMYSAIVVIERIEDLNPANDLPDYPEGFDARNGLLMKQDGGEEIDLSILEVQLVAGMQHTNMTHFSIPPDDLLLNTGITSYLEEMGDGDGILSAGEWLMIYADGCRIHDDESGVREYLMWRPDSSSAPMEIGTGDILQYRLVLLPEGREIATGEMQVILP